MVRLLGSGDEAELTSFLSARPAQTMFHRSNLRRAGIVDTGAPFSGTYAVVDDGSEIVAVAAHYWNGMLVVVGSEQGCAQSAPAAVAASGRKVSGIIGPWRQLSAAEAALGFSGRATSMRSREDLYQLEPASLIVPAALRGGGWTCRRAVEADTEQLARWRIAYNIEALGAAPGEELATRTRGEVRPGPDQDLWVLIDGGEVVAMTAFNARLPDTVQVGGVYTPPELRGRGYARAAVAGSLLSARGDGATGAILFTGEDNAPAQAAYLALGFAIVGDYGIVLYA